MRTYADRLYTKLESPFRVEVVRRPAKGTVDATLSSFGGQLETWRVQLDSGEIIYCDAKNCRPLE